jgi:hypothetical protein
MGIRLDLPGSVSNLSGIWLATWFTIRRPTALADERAPATLAEDLADDLAAWPMS